VLFLPGYACTTRIWDSLLPALSPEIDATLLDWPTAKTAGFHTLADFSQWLQSRFSLASFDWIVGHSLGGLAAAQALMQHRLATPKLILLESFLEPPTPYFQNLVMPEAPPELVERIQGMLQTERPRYSPELSIALKDVRMGEVAARSPLSMYAIYGGRGCRDPQPVIEALGWPAALKEKIPVSVVPDACHFPMLEQPQQTAAYLNCTLQ
jgi:pimeloyl-ACP methyl ester carboxylesterase